MANKSRPRPARYGRQRARPINLAGFEVERVLEEDARGPLVVVGLRAKGSLRKGDFLKTTDEVWEVLALTGGGAFVKCVLGRSTGKTETWSSSSALPVLSAIDVDRLRAEREEEKLARAAERDENRCANCWPGEPNDVDGVDRGRDPQCPNHVVTKEAVRAARVANLRRGRRKSRRPTSARGEKAREESIALKKVKDAILARGKKLPEKGPGFRGKYLALAISLGIELPDFVKARLAKKGAPV